MTNNEKLALLMKRHKLGRRDVTRMVAYPISENGQCPAVNNWLSDPTASSYRKMPDAALQLLELRLENLTAKDRAALEGPLDKAAVIAINRTKRACEQPGYVRGDGSKVKRRKRA